MIKRLASMAEQESSVFRQYMVQINSVGHEAGLSEYTTYSRLWEYPWVYVQLEPVREQQLRVLDVGSANSPLPWFLATRGFDVAVSDRKADCWRLWRQASRRLAVTVSRYILDAQDLDLPTASIDVYLSASVIEHVEDKRRAIHEAARVLRPGGLLVMTFDICEPDMGMTFPHWNGQALTTKEFDDLFGSCPWFEPVVSRLSWNTDDIPAYLGWNRKTASHHNYVVGAAVVRRGERIWVEPAWKDHVRALKRKGRTALDLVTWYSRVGIESVRRRAGRLIEAVRPGKL